MRQKYQAIPNCSKDISCQKILRSGQFIDWKIVNVVLKCPLIYSFFKSSFMFFLMILDPIDSRWGYPYVTVNRIVFGFEN